MRLFVVGNDVTLRLLAAVGVLLGVVILVLAYEAIRRSMACSTAGTDREKLLTGMTREEVAELLGRPTREQADGRLEYEYGWGVVLEVVLDEQKQVVQAVVKRG